MSLSGFPDKNYRAIFTVVTGLTGTIVPTVTTVTGSGLIIISALTSSGSAV